jgi:chitinase/chitodextrinase
MLRLIMSMGIMLLMLGYDASAQLGSKVIVGYFHNWNAAQAPYIRLRDVNPKYNVINIAFATPVSHTDMTMTFTPTQQTKAEFIADIQTLQSQGRRVQISIGGAEAPVELKTTADRDKFVASMKAIINEYGFDGYDIDLEGTSVILDAGDNNFKLPTTPKINHLISASRELVNFYRGQGKNFWLTAAPETQYVQGGYANYGTAYGGYLPVLYALRDLLTFVHVQYYNTGSQVALDEKVYAQSTPDFIVAMTEMLLKGFPVARNTANVFPALREDQVAFGLPATNTGAAPAGGYVAPADINRALDYLIKGISFGGQYVTSKSYPGVRGIMTWSANWDKTQGDAFVNNAYTYFSGTGGNISPSVSITSPANNANFATGSNITISANASDSDGTVSKVEFFRGPTKLGEDLSSPYSHTWNAVPSGSYTLTAKATDNLGASTTSSIVNITVGTVTNNPPVVSITSPSNGASFTAPASITISANATDDGSVSKVEFFQGASKLGEDTSSPYSFTWANVAAGTYSLTAKATDNAGLSTTSSAVSVTVSGTGSCTEPQYVENGGYSAGSKVKNVGNVYECRPYPYSGWCNGSAWAYAPGTGAHWADAWTLIGPCSGGNNSPVASITSPTNNATFTAPASITINASATDDGSITKVEFFQGTTKLGEDFSTPYSFSWGNVGAGTYSLTVKATDNLGATTTSSAVSVTVNSGNTPPTATITSPANNATFTAPASITINATASDNGSVTKVEFFQGSTKLGEDTSTPYSFNWTNVAAGTYSLTAKATDNLGLTGTSAAVNITVNGTNPLPTVSITSPANGATFTAPASITITANASDNGSVVKVEFFQGTTKLGEDLSTPYSFNWSNVASGTYSLTAKATDNQNATNTSAAISITVNTSSGCTDPQYVENSGYVAGSRVQNVGNSYQCRPHPNSGWCNGAAWAYAPGTGTYWQDAWTLIGACTGGNGAPTVNITAPANFSQFPSGQTVSITASASDADGSVSKVEFLVDGSKIGEDTSSPYSISWTGANGTHILIARATDNSGNTKESSSVTVTIGSTNNGNLPARIMSGYWHSWVGGVPFIKLRDVSSKWDVINISFAEPVTQNSTDGRMKFVLSGATADYTVSDFKADVKLKQSQGKKVVISIGGYEGYFSLTSDAARVTFVNDMKNIINEYGFDGIDIDLEQTSVELNVGDADFRNPTSAKVVQMIAAIREIMNAYGSNFILSFAPEAFYLQLGYQWYAGLHSGADRRAGVYIPMIHALRDKVTYVQSQLYNQPSIMALDGRMYTSGTSDYLVSMTDMLLKGFNVGGNSSYFFPPLRPDQVLIAVPASQNAAGSGQVTNQQLQQAFDYLARGTSFGGQYVLTSTYPSLRGIMAWSINWDVLQNNNGFVNSNRAYLDGFGAGGGVHAQRAIHTEVSDLSMYPNPVVEGGMIHITLDATYPEVTVSVIDINGISHLSTVHQKVKDIDVQVPRVASGLYLLQVTTPSKRWIKKIIKKD